MKKFSIGIGVFALALVAIFVLQLFGFGSFAFFAPKYREVERQTFEQSRAFNEGMVRDLENLCLQYQGGTPAQQSALASTIRHRIAGYPNTDQLPAHVRACLNNITRS
jgi:hypothetical protein